VTTLDRTAQIPHWLDLSTVNFASVPSKDSPVLRIHPHSELFKTGNSNEKEALLWRDSVLPSFNSLAIESQLANLDLTSRTAVYLNDDFFLNEVSSLSLLCVVVEVLTFRLAAASLGSRFRISSHGSCLPHATRSSS